MGSLLLPDRKRIGYRPSLDGLRGVAVLIVMAFHSQLPYTQWGYLGVDVFFVLSGFLITAVLLEEWIDNGKIALTYFYIRRVLRLFPALVVLILASLLPLNPIAFMDRAKAGAIAFFYGSNWARALEWDVEMSGLSHTWSLSIEEQFYLLWPATLIVLLGMKWSPSRVAGLLTAGVVASAALRVALFYGGSSPERLYNGLDTRADSLLAGCALGVVFAFGIPISRRMRWGAATVSVLLVPAIAMTLASEWNDDFMFIAGYATVVLVTLGILALLVGEGAPLLRRMLEFPMLVGIGRISYGLYLWHYPLFNYVDLMELSQPVRLAAMVGSVFAAAGVSYYLIERPCLRLKSRFQPSVLRSAIPERRLAT